jgi:large subunit ribosomal protein L35Ae
VKLVSESIQGTIVNYRIGQTNQRSKECIIQFAHFNSASEASRLIGRKVALKSGKNRILGKIVAPHGKKGLLVARFRKGVPGQALGTIVQLVG